MSMDVLVNVVIGHNVTIIVVMICLVSTAQIVFNKILEAVDLDLQILSRVNIAVG